MQKAWKSLWIDGDAAVMVRAQWGILTGYALFGVVLLGAWWFDWAGWRVAWDGWDRAVFVAANDSLRSGGSWAAFWAATNTRWFDVVPAALILSLYAHYLFADGGRFWKQRFELGLWVFAFIGLWMQFAMKALLDFGRASPTLTLPDPVLLSEMFDWPLHIKDSSMDCFPGDHVGVMVLVGMVMFHVAGRWRGLCILLAALLFALPRIFGGAHWFSDQLIGGGFAGLLGAVVFLGVLKLRPGPHMHTATDRTAVSA
jgi:hypothetical protein